MPHMGQCMCNSGLYPIGVWGSLLGLPIRTTARVTYEFEYGHMRHHKAVTSTYGICDTPDRVVYYKFEWEKSCIAIYMHICRIMPGQSTYLALDTVLSFSCAGEVAAREEVVRMVRIRDGPHSG